MFPSNVKEHYASMEDTVFSSSKKRLLDKAKQAAAWGTSDNESMGYSQAELCAIIHQLINFIEKQT